MQLALLCTFGASATSRIIVRRTVPKAERHGHAPSHVGILDEDEGKWTYTEAHADSHQFGGPYPVSTLHKWMSQDDARAAWMVTIPSLTPNQIQEIRQKIRNNLGMLSYDRKHLAQFYMWSLLRIPFPENGGKMICSEVVSRLFYPAHNIPACVLGTTGLYSRLSPWQVQQYFKRRGEIKALPHDS